MLQAGEDPLYVARRVVRMAVEDVGLAAPEALNLCLSARDAYDFLGSPEGDLALAQAVVYLALAPKSNAVYTAYGAVQADIEATAAEPVPLHLRNAPTKLMKSLDYGKGYQYAHNVEGRVADMDCLPPSLRTAATTIRPRKAARRRWRSGWRRSGASARTSAANNNRCGDTSSPKPASWPGIRSRPGELMKPGLCFGEEGLCARNQEKEAEAGGDQQPAAGFGD